MLVSIVGAVGEGNGSCLQCSVVRSCLACLVAILVDVLGFLALGCIVVSLAVHACFQIVACVLTIAQHAGHHVLSAGLGICHHGIGSFFGGTQIGHLDAAHNEPVLPVVGVSVVDPAYCQLAVLCHAVGCLCVASCCECHTCAVGTARIAHLVGLVVVTCTVLALFGLGQRQCIVIGSLDGRVDVAHYGKGVYLVAAIYLVGLSGAQEAVVAECIDTVGHALQCLCDAA